ncbi:hypothetical protein ACQ4PT_024979 [Festuca glaucescens]
MEEDEEGGGELTEELWTGEEKDRVLPPLVAKGRKVYLRGNAKLPGRPYAQKHIQLIPKGPKCLVHVEDVRPSRLPSGIIGCLLREHYPGQVMMSDDEPELADPIITALTENADKIEDTPVVSEVKDFIKIAWVIEKVSKEEILKNRLRLKTSIDVVKWLALQACSFRGNKEGPSSNNQGNFLEMVKVLSSYNEEVAALVGNAPVLKAIASSKGASPSARGKAAGSVKLMMSFDFVFILHVMKELMGITDLLCKKLQQKSQDIVNAMHDVATTKELIQKLRDDGWTNLLCDVMLFCKKHVISVPDMDGFYVDFIRSRKEDETSSKHHYKYDVFTVAVDQQLQELNSRFSVQSTELLILCTSLDPRNSFRSFNLENICLLATKFYPSDFSEHERDNLRCQLRHYELDVLRNQEFLNLSTIAELCQKLFETEKLTDYHLIDRLIRLVLTLPVSTATTERAFSAMKLVKSRLRNKMEDLFLRDCLIIYIEREIALTFTTDTIIDDFDARKKRRVDFN